MRKFKYIFQDIIDAPNDLYRKIKKMVQRAYRGWSNEDTWCFDFYLADVIENGLIHLKNTACGYPANLTEEEWNNVLKKIILTFKTAKQIIDNHYIYTFSQEYDTEENKNLRRSLGKLDFCTIMTKEECQSYEEGWKLFQEYFHSLWS